MDPFYITRNNFGTLLTAIRCEDVEITPQFKEDSHWSTSDPFLDIEGPC